MENKPATNQPKMSDEEISLTNHLKSINEKIRILGKQKLTKERIEEGSRLNYEKDLIKYDLMKINPQKNTYKKPEINKPASKHDIAKKVKSIKGFLRM